MKVRQSTLDALSKKMFSSKEKVVVSEWKERCLSLIERPDDTQEFEDLIHKQIERFEAANFSCEGAARMINKTINILYYQRHPAKHMVLLAAII